MREQDPICSLKGVGDKSTALFSKCKLHTIEDLANHFPRYYESFTAPVTFADLKDGENMAVVASVHSRMTVRPTRRLKVCLLKVKDATGIREIAWFNMPFLANVFRVNQKYVFTGDVIKKNGVLTFQHPKYFTLEEYRALQNTKQPVYPLTEGLTNNLVRKCMKQLRPFFHQKKEFLSNDYLRDHQLISLSEAYENIHFPISEQAIIDARKRLVFQEFFKFMVYMDVLKENQEVVENGFAITDSTKAHDLIQKLPYQLTSAQMRTFQEIVADLTSDTVMNRLVQGDVGSGKTIVAVLALVTVVEAGYQGALMAPTEVLARQHYESLSKMLEPYDITVGLLTGSTKGAEKKEVYRQIKDQKVDIIVGTHALIQEKVEYANLALAITDEQHRFGVHQREQFAAKGMHPHVLVMSATPIPRTLAMMLYADMSISIMDELPANRLPIKNCVVGQSYRPAAIKFMNAEITNGHQCYVICPMVAESEATEAENVIDYADKLSAALPQARITYLHGKMKDIEKNEIMYHYAKGEIDILVSTTVIEVGINVPNSTFMLIENAERFGLAALHQLRGRVGRGDAQSYCVFMYGKDTEKTKERLEVLNQSNDGFEIAREDLKLRGPGDFFGIRQSGELDFKMADIYQDADILTLANQYLQDCKKQGVDIQKLVDVKTGFDNFVTI